MTSTDTATATDTDTDVWVEPVTTDHGDHERFAHYADRDKITEAMVTGTPVVALCGKVWVPSRDPKKYPICPDCQRLFDLGPEGRMNEWRDRANQS
ncbi:MAG TPA: DUF3039 domain-containing protein [Mycobacteriales bacterium]|nr:DUF3039 domain-containing protein [Mycobacteriales bacterium]